VVMVVAVVAKATLMVAVHAGSGNDVVVHGDGMLVVVVTG